VWLALGLPVLAAVALMLPRILSPQFVLFDDATSISIGHQTWNGEWDWRQDLGQYGRFRPVYWLAYSLTYRLAGYHAAWYFVGNLFLLAGTGFLIAWTLLRITRKPLAAGVAGMAFVLGGPVVEAAYTLSKPELLQVFLPGGLSRRSGVLDRGRSHSCVTRKRAPRLGRHRSTTDRT
jgi:hypothetical protein